MTKIPLLAKEFGVSADWLLSDAPPAEDRADTAPPEIPPRTQGAYPDWIEKLPSHIVTMIRKFGWIYGVWLALFGLLVTAMGCIARFIFHRMIFGFDTGFGTFGITGYDPFADFRTNAWGTVSVFTGFIIALGIVFLILGTILAIVLKKWGKNGS